VLHLVPRGNQLALKKGNSEDPGDYIAHLSHHRLTARDDKSISDDPAIRESLAPDDGPHPGGGGTTHRNHNGKSGDRPAILKR
jgi:hypothetical protein